MYEWIEEGYVMECDGEEERDREEGQNMVEEHDMKGSLM